jgi:hypothetical protein
LSDFLASEVRGFKRLAYALALDRLVAGLFVIFLRKSKKSVDCQSINNDNDSHIQTRRPA